MSNVTNDDLDFNIEEIEQVIAPQIDSGSTDDSTDKGGKGEEDPSIKGHVSCSRKAWCC